MRKQALTYDDIQLIPNFSDIPTRQNISLAVNVSRNWTINIPLVGSCMDTVTEYEMAATLMEMGGVGCIHRFMSIEEQVAQVKKLVAFRDGDITLSHLPIMAAVGVVGDYLDRALELEKAGCNIILIDIAHGHHENMEVAIGALKQNLQEDVTDVIAGNIATAAAAEDLIAWGADGLRVGIGGGSLCTTRVKTGFGVPNVTSIEDVFEVADSAGVPIMADGGIKSSGDIAKALAVGADCVMVGSLLAGTKESPGAILETPAGLFKRYRGSASLETKITHAQKQRNVEGESTTIPFKGGARFIINGLTDGIKSAFSYAGANDLLDYFNRAEYNVVTNAGLAEATTTPYSMINLKFIEKSPEYPLGQIHCKVDSTAGWLLDKSEFPLIFTIWEEGKIKWSTELEPDWFATWDPLQLEGCEARVTTQQGKLLKSFQPPLDATHTFLYEWASRNQGAKGIVIGTNDGTHGEWVKPLQSGQLVADLVEGSRETSLECKKNWPDMHVQNCIATTDGQQVSWYEFGTGEANTIDYDHALKHNGHEDVVGTMKETVGIRELMQADDYRWMHLDLEGIDDEIIMAMDFEQHSKPELIIFETINISPERLNGDESRLHRISEWLRQHGYKFYYDYWNSFAFLTNK